MYNFSIFIFLFITLLSSFSGVTAQNFPLSPKLKKTIEDSVDNEYVYLRKLYQHLHAHPELSFCEKNTSARLAKELQNIGFQVTSHIGGYGIVGVMKNGIGPTILVRTDMDALPSMGGEDFALYGLQTPKIPICMFYLGSTNPKQIKGSSPSLHSPFYAPLTKPTIKTGVKAMTGAVLQLMLGK